jgi:hypothetical protein
MARRVGENKCVQNGAERTDVSTWTRMGDDVKMGINERVYNDVTELARFTLVTGSSGL